MLVENWLGNLSMFFLGRKKVKKLNFRKPIEINFDAPCDNQNWLNAVNIFNYKLIHDCFPANYHIYFNREVAKYLQKFNEKGKVYDAQD